MLRSRRESPHNDGITEPDNLQQTFATKSASIARGRRWLDELTTDATATADSIAKREGCSARKVNMTISLAFLAPDLVRAAIEGRLPHGMGVTRLADLPAEWSRQYQMLGLPTQQPRIRTTSLRTKISVSGKGNFADRDKGPETGPKVRRRQCRDSPA